MAEPPKKKSNLLKFPIVDRELKTMLEISDQIDAIITQTIAEGTDTHNVAGLLAHRLGTLLRVLRNDSLTDTCLDIIIERLNAEKSG